MQVSRDAVTGISRGCGYVTMSSLAEAKAAISALDGSVSSKTVFVLIFKSIEFSIIL